MIVQFRHGCKILEEDRIDFVVNGILFFERGDSCGWHHIAGFKAGVRVLVI